MYTNNVVHTCTGGPWSAKAPSTPGPSGPHTLSSLSETKTFTVEDAVETIGFGRFHIALFLIMGSTGVSALREPLRL